ncbi:hypothetical protein BASA61_000759 [Batrachochytrium salamandrivorans]|nr:hypothetical protein BASA61_000759 [Batrachochytrium salamandrivorans]
MLVSSVIALLAIGSTSVSAVNYAKFNLLKNDRDADRLVFIPTTLAQKEIILSNVKNALAIWASYKSKIDHYGPAADPFPIVEKLRETINTVVTRTSSLDLLMPLSWPVISTPAGPLWHHTAASMPPPAVTSTSEYPDIRLLFGKDYSKIQAGDELLAINGLSFVNWFQQNQFTSGGGANVFGGHRAALDYLTTIYGAINRLPNEDFITFQFKSHANPHTSYTAKVPYVSGRNEDCWKLGSKLYKSIISKTLLGTPETSLSSESTNMGIIRLDSFDPEDVGTTNLAILKATMTIRSLLVNELKDTKSVMYDLRGNSGGDVKFANSMVQLFKSDFKPFGDRYLMNQITFNIFVNGKNPNIYPHAKAWQETKAWQGTEPGRTRCWKPSLEKTSRLVVGGAIVMKLDPTLVRASPSDFQKFPFSNELTSGSITYANTLSVGVTQIVRTGRYNGQDIEDAGIEPEIIVRPRWSDLQPDSTTNTPV